MGSSPRWWICMNPNAIDCHILKNQRRSRVDLGQTTAHAGEGKDSMKAIAVFDPEASKWKPAEMHIVFEMPQDLAMFWMRMNIADDKRLRMRTEPTS